MWNGRIRPVKNNGGSILVADEEGFNNLTEANRYTFINRLDRAAAQVLIYILAGARLTMVLGERSRATT